MNTNELYKLLDELQELCDESRNLRNDIFLDQLAFYKLTLQFKKSLLQPMFKQPPVELEEEFRRKFDPVVKEIDAFENVVDAGKFRLFGKALVQKKLYQEHLEQVRSALQKAEQTRL